MPSSHGRDRTARRSDDRERKDRSRFGDLRLDTCPLTMLAPLRAEGCPQGAITWVIHGTWAEEHRITFRPQSRCRR
jgi:hypothetical protein